MVMLSVAFGALLCCAASPPDAMREIMAGFYAGTGRGAIPVTIPGPHTVEIIARDGTNLHTVWTLPGSEQEQYSTVIDRSP